MNVFNPEADENLLGITDKQVLNEEEAKGIIRAEEFVLDLESDVVIDVSLVLQLHDTAFGHLYTWAGKWRRTELNIGVEPEKIPNRMYQFLDELKFRISQIRNKQNLIDCLSYAHHQFVQIHPFRNGNGRTARLITDLIAKQHGYQNIVLYVREEGEARSKYIHAVQLADEGDYSELNRMIEEQLLEL